jgi:hypothetical protein
MAFVLSRFELGSLRQPSDEEDEEDSGAHNFTELIPKGKFIDKWYQGV